MILTGDTGGTKTRLAAYSIEDNKLSLQYAETFASRDFDSLEEIARGFIMKHEITIKKACFGVPGPVVDGRVKITNLPWQMDEIRIAASLDIPKAKLVNDLAATAAAIPHFGSTDLATLHKGNPQGDETVYGVLAPGTGLGVGFFIGDPGGARLLASEGGHVDFAPTNELEIDLLRYLLAKFERVSYERIVCGPGLVSIYHFLKDTGRESASQELEARFDQEDPAAVISSGGLSGDYQICVRALDIFSSALGSQAGNIALTTLATGGIYLGGGIPPKIIQKLKDGTTVKAYLNKGRLSGFVEQIPLHVILDDRAALIGAAHIAMDM